MMVAVYRQEFSSQTVVQRSTAKDPVLVPVVVIYLVLQRRFIEGVERSGIVG